MNKSGKSEFSFEKIITFLIMSDVLVILGYVLKYVVSLEEFAFIICLVNIMFIACKYLSFYMKNRR